LHKKEMIGRSKCASDKRQVDVTITSKGLETLAELDHLMGDYENKFNHVDKKAIAEVNNVLDELRNI